MLKKASLILFIFTSMNVSANTAWFSGWQAYKPTNWQTIGTWYSCISIVNISSGSIEVTVNYYSSSGEIVTPPLTGYSAGTNPKAILGPRQSVGWCTAPSQLATGTNMWGAGIVTATPLDGQTEPALVAAQADLRNLAPSGSYNAWTNVPVNGGLPF
ncbi:MAG: hypothetical protein ACRC7D_12720 [Aeromonas popoffii]|uniref:hypothetical protein n=1 Tax=Aeromonas popoffii TaxID=70856 RepID=UPI003F33286B